MTVCVMHAHIILSSHVAVDVGFETPPVYIVSESAGSVRVCAVLTGQRAMGRSVMVTFTTAGGSAVGQSVLCIRWQLLLK